MSLEIVPIGGYGEVGKNMTAVKVDDEVIIFDCGIHLPNYIIATEQGAFRHYTEQELRPAHAIPDDEIIANWRAKVIAIIPSHGHLDHVGNGYNFPCLNPCLGLLLHHQP